MNKQAYYLPNLNSLFIQNKLYQKHVSRLKQIKSQCKEKNRNQIINHQGLQVQSHQIELNQNEKYYPIQKLTQKMRIQEQGNHKQSQRLLSPYQKRKMWNRVYENKRMYNALQFSKSTIDPYNKTNESDHQSLKKRIQKYSRDGQTMNYKYKKSLIKILKKREEEKHRQIAINQSNTSKIIDKSPQKYIKLNEKQIKRSHAQLYFYKLKYNRQPYLLQRPNSLQLLVQDRKTNTRYKQVKKIQNSKPNLHTNDKSCFYKRQLLLKGVQISKMAKIVDLMPLANKLKIQSKQFCCFLQKNSSLRSMDLIPKSQNKIQQFKDLEIIQITPGMLNISPNCLKSFQN